MLIIDWLINLGVATQNEVADTKYIRLANSVALLVIIFTFVSFITSLVQGERELPYVHLFHMLLLIPTFLFNWQGKYNLASSWFSSQAILFLTIYGIAFDLETNTIFFLTLIVFLQFFLFPYHHTKLIILFILTSALCYGIVLSWHFFKFPDLLSISHAANQFQRLNVFAGMLLLSTAFGAYAHYTMTKSEKAATDEKQKSDRLLLNILPEVVANRLKTEKSFIAEGFNNVSVLFTDIADFTSLSQKLSPNELVSFLNEIFSKFDDLTEDHKLEKIKTIGDAYMVAGGLPGSPVNHAIEICHMALSMQKVIQNMKYPFKKAIQIRIGIHVGPVTAGVIGAKKFSYDLWGDTVNTASRMESLCPIGQIQLSEEVYKIAKSQFQIFKRGPISVKGKGELNTYLLKSAKNVMKKAV